MAIQSRKNQYRGVNAHLHSYYQNRGGWESFHNMHVAHLGEALNARLPQGYLVNIEQSLQVIEYQPETGEHVHRPKLDLTIHATQPIRGTSTPSTLSAPAATMTQPILQTIDLIEEDYYVGLVLYRITSDAIFGRPVTRVELLSPTNKRGIGKIQYTEKRQTAIKGGLNLVEIDYLHQTPSPIRGIPDYTQKQPGSYPYNITVSNPNPSLAEGIVTTYAFHADTPIPTIEIPLEGSDSVTLNFDEVYKTTFESLTAFSYPVDYEQLPLHFDTYTPFDQARIERRANAVAQAYRQGINLEDAAPLPVEEEKQPG